MSKEFIDPVDDPFMPMYTDDIVVQSGSLKTSFRTFVSNDTTDDMITEESIETQRETISIVFMRKDFMLVHGIKRGDVVIRYPELRQHKKYTVKEVKWDSLFGYVVVAREIH